MGKQLVLEIKDVLVNCYKKIENNKGKCFEIISFLMFVLLTAFLSCFHEPWSDEMQAWQISKASLTDILFVIPHYEGHPPFWALLLKCFSFFNVPVEWGLKIPNLLLTYGALWLLIFKSPFSRTIRIFLPFTYFIFYQTTIINRPYSIFCFALFLIAFFYETRNERPFRFVFLIFLLCLSSLYGMALAAGITIAWLIEIFKKQNPITYMKTFVKDKRCFAMLGLLVLALLLLWIIFPDQKTQYYAMSSKFEFLVRLFYSFWGIVADATITDFFNISCSDLSATTMNTPAAWSTIGVGFVVFLFVYRFCWKMGKIWEFLIPYAFLSIVLFLYSYPHHIALVFIFLIYSFWVVLKETKLSIDFKYPACWIGVLCLIICVQLHWSFAAFLNEYNYDYAASRSLAKFIKENKLDKYKIISSWLEYTLYIDTTNKVFYKPNEVKYMDTSSFIINKLYDVNSQGISVMVNPYFKNNIFINFNVDKPHKLYKQHIVVTKEYNQKIKDMWAAKFSNPEVIVLQRGLDLLLNGKDLLTDDYVIVKLVRIYWVWKNQYFNSDYAILVRKDIANKHKFSVACPLEMWK